MPLSDWIVCSPSITPLRRGIGGESSDRISMDTYIKLSTDTPNCRIFFTTDTSEPDVFGDTISGLERTFKYKGPFKLRPGIRTIKAMAITRGDHKISRTNMRTFHVSELSDLETEASYISSSSVFSEQDPRYELASSFHGIDSKKAWNNAVNIGRNFRSDSMPAAIPDYNGAEDILSDDYETTLASVSQAGASDYPSQRSSSRSPGRSRSRSPGRSRSLSRSHRSLSRSPRSRSGSPTLTHLTSENGYSSGYTGIEEYFDDSQRRQDGGYRRQYDYDSDNETYVSNYFKHRPSSRSPRRDYFQESLQSSRVQFDTNPTAYHASPSSHYQPRRQSPPRKSHQDYDRKHPATTLKHGAQGHSKPRAEGHDQRKNDLDLLSDLSEITSDVSPPSTERLSRRSQFEEEQQRKTQNKSTNKMPQSESHNVKVKSKVKVTSESSDSSLSPSSSAVSIDQKDNAKKGKNKSRKKLDENTQVIKEEKSTKNKARKSKIEEDENDQEKHSIAALASQAHRSRAPLSNVPSSTVQDGALTFINDSGTQMNFWGVDTSEVMEKMNSRFPRASNGSDLPGKNRSSERNSPVSAIQQAVAHSAPPMKAKKPEPPASLPSQPPAKPPLAKSEQSEQQSIGGFFKKLFKGWISDDKPDPRLTVKELDEESDKPGYEEIRTECLEEGKLWEDPDFPADDRSVFYSKKPDGDKKIEWLRPHEICESPQMFVGGASRFDIQQGELGNCWLLASLAALTSSEKLLYRVVPRDQTFDEEQYAGVFHYYFWQYGRWVEVCIDDRLPTIDGQLMALHSAQGNEFWAPLLEKAYAKLSGSYETLSGGLASEGMTDLTGGVCERFNFKEEIPDYMFSVLLKARQKGSLMSCSIDAVDGAVEEQMKNGLIRGHAYTITDVKQVPTTNGNVDLMRVRNPWGNECEWKGAWSDQSSEWSSIPDKTKQSLGLSFDHDGEFWMSFKDFSTYFQRVEVCNLSPDDLLDEGDDAVKWSLSVLSGAWRTKVNAGGCRNSPKTYWTNPQYCVEVVDADDDDDEELGTIIIGLMQRGRRRMRAVGQGNFTIGYDIYKSEGSSKLEKKFFDRHDPVASSPTYINTREVCGRHRLPPGQYVVMPTTFDPNEEAAFVIRIYSEKGSNIIEADESTGVVQAKPMRMVQSAPSQKAAADAGAVFAEHSGEDKEVDAYELMDILNSTFTQEFQFGGFDKNLCRSLVALRDADRTAKLGEEEFKLLWDDLQTWKNLYKQSIQDQNGQFSSFDLRESLRDLGFSVSNGTFSLMVARYSNTEGFITFDDFVACVVNLQHVVCNYQRRAANGQVQMELDELLQLSL